MHTPFNQVVINTITVVKNPKDDHPNCLSIFSSIHLPFILFT